jgi:hypothetical protein
MKVARVDPLFKSGKDTIISNYRPVSILPVFSKLFERLMYDRLMNFSTANNLLYKYQFGFRCNYSTSMALVTLVDKIMSAIDNGNMVVGVFLDFQKAFDTVNHNILLNKLYKYGIRGVAFNWLKDYLSNRYQYVTFDNHDSQKKLIKCGVPQGSILGPLLFLLYINDITNVSDTIFPIIFADDTNIFLTGKNIDEIILNMNYELQNIVKWLNANKLSLNVGKTQYMIFRSQKTKISSSSELLINGTSLDYVESSKFLGVHIDSCFTWNRNIQSVRSKVSRGIGILNKAKHALNTATLITLYYSFIYPYLSYCIEVWGKAANTYTMKLLVLQKRVVRKIKSAPFRSESAPLFRELGLLNLKQLYKFQIIIFMFKFVKGMLPNIFNDIFTKRLTTASRVTRQLNNLNIPRCHTSAFQRTVCYQGPSEWNAVCEVIDHFCSVHTYKKRIKKYLLSEF